MKVYERRASSPFKWIFAGLLFLFAMTFTMADVYGFNYPPKSHDNNDPNGCIQPNYDGNHHHADGGDHDNKFPPDNNQPTAVPEPTTLLLMAGGLGVAAWYRSRKTA